MDSPCSFKACATFLSFKILDRLDSDHLKTLRNIEKLCKKSVKFKSDCAFLKFSIENQLVPKFTDFKLYKKDRRYSKNATEFRMKLMAEELEDKIKSQSEITNKCARLVLKLRTSLSVLRFYACVKFLHRILKPHEDNCLIKLNKKASNLYGSPISLKNSSSAIFNVSSHELTPAETSLLNKGLKLGLKTKTNPLDRMIEVESLADSVLRDGLRRRRRRALVLLGPRA